LDSCPCEPALGLTFTGVGRPGPSCLHRTSILRDQRNGLWSSLIAKHRLDEHDSMETDTMAMTKGMLFNWEYKCYSRHEVQERQVVGTSLSDHRAISYLFYVVW